MLICAAFADKPTDIVCEELSQDIEATAGCLTAMGADISYSKETRIFHVVPVDRRAIDCVRNSDAVSNSDLRASEADGACDAVTKVPHTHVQGSLISEKSQGNACASQTAIDVGESGSTLRFILPVVAALGINTHIVMHGRLSERPLSPLWEELEAHGVKLTKNADSTMDVEGRLSGSRYSIAADVSSQFISGLLFAAPLIADKTGDFELELTGNVESINYILMTIDALKSFGVKVERIDKSSDSTIIDSDGCTEDGAGNVSAIGAAVNQSNKASVSSILRISRDASYTSPGELKVEGDWSNGAFWICAAALTGDTLKVTGLKADSTQGDRAVTKLRDAIINGRDIVGRKTTAVDATAEQESNLTKANDAKQDTGDKAASANKIGSECAKKNAAAAAAEPVIIDARNVPDLVPVLSVLAAGVKGETVFTHAERLRIKESDRIKSTVAMLKTLGAQAEETEDGLRVIGTGAKLRGGTIDSCNDHRIAMSAAVASIICEGTVTVLTAQAVRKSYPAFWEDFARLGGCVDVIM